MNPMHSEVLGAGPLPQLNGKDTRDAMNPVHREQRSAYELNMAQQ